MSVLDEGAGPGANGKRRRRLWSEGEKRRIVAETTEPGASVSVVARRHDVNANMVFTWRRELGAGVSVAADAATTFIPAVIGPVPVAVASPARPSLASRMEIALGGGIRVIVGADVDTAALARVIKVLARR
jgi:transposase-like protein